VSISEDGRERMRGGGRKRRNRDMLRGRSRSKFLGLEANLHGEEKS
jgi:hypothetical protein